VCENSVGVCVHQMNKYLPHAYILKHTKSIKRVYIHKNIREKKERQRKKKEQKGSHGKKSTLIDWPNSLTIVLSGVANCRKLPFGGRATRDSRVRLPQKENARSRHQRLFEENIGKTGKIHGLRTLSERFGSCIYARGRY